MRGSSVPTTSPSAGVSGGGGAAVASGAPVEGGEETSSPPPQAAASNAVNDTSAQKRARRRKGRANQATSRTDVADGVLSVGCIVIDCRLKVGHLQGWFPGVGDLGGIEQGIRRSGRSRTLVTSGFGM